MSALSSGGKSSRTTHQDHPRQKSTSLSASVILMGQITMSFADMEAVMHILSKAEISARNQTEMTELSAHEMALVAEFGEAVQSLQ